MTIGFFMSNNSNYVARLIPSGDHNLLVEFIEAKKNVYVSRDDKNVSFLTAKVKVLSGDLKDQTYYMNYFPKRDIKVDDNGKYVRNEDGSVVELKTWTSYVTFITKFLEHLGQPNEDFKTSKACANLENVAIALTKGKGSKVRIGMHCNVKPDGSRFYNLSTVWGFDQEGFDARMAENEAWNAKVLEDEKKRNS